MDKVGINPPRYGSLEGSTEILARDGDIAIRKMRNAEADYRLLERWLTEPRLLEFVYGRNNAYSFERIVAKFGARARGEDGVVAGIITIGGQAIGYLQFYPASEEDYELDDDVADTYGMDMFIGEPAYWGRGVGTRVLSALTYVLLEKRGLRRILMDPQTLNARAIRCYEKAGFKRVKVLVAHEMHESAWRDCWLMMKER